MRTQRRRYAAGLIPPRPFKTRLGGPGASFEPETLPRELWPIFYELQTAQAELDRLTGPDGVRPC